jgi:hypothetical protein
MTNKEMEVRKARNRTALLISYRRMVKILHVKKPITAAQFATMDNTQVMRLAKTCIMVLPSNRPRRSNVL